MVVGSRLPRTSHGILSPTSQTHLYNVLEQANGPGVLQTFSTCAVNIH